MVTAGWLRHQCSYHKMLNFNANDNANDYDVENENDNDNKNFGHFF